MMKMFDRYCVLWLALLALLSFFVPPASSADMSKEPRDFRGIRWGQDVSTLPDMVLRHNDVMSATSFYTKKNEDLDFGKAKLEEIEYVFVNDNLSKVTLVTRGAENERALLEEARRLFGEETLEMEENSVWRFQDVAVFYMRESETEQAVLYFRYLVDIP